MAKTWFLELVLALPLVVGLAMPEFAEAQSSQSGTTTEPETEEPGASELSILDDDLVSIDVVGIAGGFRATTIVGQDVTNDFEEEIGTIDDLVITQDDQVVFAVISVGGFLGIGDRLVAVPYDRMRFSADGAVVIPGATKELLESLPEFRYRDD